MSIPNVVNPVGDLSNGAIVTPTIWNSLFDTLYNYLNSVVVPAIGALQAAPSLTAIVPAQGMFNARLSTVSGNGCPVPDQISAANLFLSAYGGGDVIGLYNTTSGSWTGMALAGTVPTIAVPAATRDLCDIFVYNNGSGWFLEADLYQTATASNNPAAGTAVTINTASTALFAVGDVISISAGGLSEDTCVTSVAVGTSITVDFLSNSYTTPILHSQQPSVAIALQNGVPVKQTDASRRYAGTVFIVSSTVTDSAAQRGIGNLYNRQYRPVLSMNTATTFAQASGTNPSNGNKTIGTERILFVAPFGVTTPFEINREESNSSTVTYLLENIDGAQYPYGTQGGSPGNVSLDINSAVSNVGRHVIDDYFKGAAGATITNIANSVQVSYTTGRVLN